MSSIIFSSLCVATSDANRRQVSARLSAMGRTMYEAGFADYRGRVSQVEEKSAALRISRLYTMTTRTGALEWWLENSGAKAASGLPGILILTEVDANASGEGRVTVLQGGRARYFPVDLTGEDGNDPLDPDADEDVFNQAAEAAEDRLLRDFLAGHPDVARAFAASSSAAWRPQPAKIARR